MLHSMASASSTVVKPHHPKVEGLSPASVTGTEREKMSGKKFYNMTSDSNKMVENLPNHPKVEGFSLVAIAGTRKNGR
jgi:hypothetical protein